MNTYSKYLMHGKDWQKHKYLKKTEESGYTRYWCTDKGKEADSGENNDSTVKAAGTLGKNNRNLDLYDGKYKSIKDDDLEKLNHSALLGEAYLLHSDEDDLEHSGILGMKWGVRRWQNEDGTLTPEGREHYAKKYKRMSPEYAAYADGKTRQKTKVSGVISGTLGGLVGAGLVGAGAASAGLIPVAAISVGAVSAGYTYVKSRIHYGRVYEQQAAIQLARSGQDYVYHRTNSTLSAWDL